MVLKIGEQRWHLHFHTTISNSTTELWDVVTTCLVHTGPCILTTAEPKYCVNGRVGRASCSKRDQFVRSVGNRLALTRALEHVPPATRRQIWQAYWQRVKRPKETPQQFRERLRQGLAHRVSELQSNSPSAQAT